MADFIIVTIAVLFVIIFTITAVKKAKGRTCCGKCSSCKGCTEKNK